MSKTRAYAITAEAVAREAERVGGDLEKVDVAKVIQLDELVLPEVGPRDVKLKILAASGEHNISHAALADTVNIAEARGGKMYPGNSAVGEVIAVGAQLAAEADAAEDRRSPTKASRSATSCSPTATASPTSTAIRCASGPTTSRRLDRLVQRRSRGRRLAARACAARLRSEPVGDGRAAVARADGLSPVAPRARHIPRQGPARAARDAQRASFGGGVGECFLMLAKAEGHNAYFCSGSPERRAALEKLGIKGIDQKKFNRFKTRPASRRSATIARS